MHFTVCCSCRDRPACGDVLPSRLGGRGEGRVALAQWPEALISTTSPLRPPCCPLRSLFPILQVWVAAVATHYGAVLQRLDRLADGIAVAHCGLEAALAARDSHSPRREEMWAGRGTAEVKIGGEGAEAEEERGGEGGSVRHAGEASIMKGHAGSAVTIVLRAMLHGRRARFIGVASSGEATLRVLLGNLLTRANSLPRARICFEVGALPRTTLGADSLLVALWPAISGKCGSSRVLSLGRQLSDVGIARDALRLCAMMCAYLRPGVRRALSRSPLPSATRGTARAGDLPPASGPGGRREHALLAGRGCPQARQNGRRRGGGRAAPVLSSFVCPESSAGSGNMDGLKLRRFPSPALSSWRPRPTTTVP